MFLTGFLNLLISGRGLGLGYVSGVVLTVNWKKTWRVRINLPSFPNSWAISISSIKYPIVGLINLKGHFIFIIYFTVSSTTSVVSSSGDFRFRVVAIFYFDLFCFTTCLLYSVEYKVSLNLKLRQSLTSFHVIYTKYVCKMCLSKNLHKKWFEDFPWYTLCDHLLTCFLYSNLS